MFRDEFDTLLKQHKIEEAKKFIETSLYNAIVSKNTEEIIIILNEIIGFYRDLNENETSLKYANSLLKMLDNISLDINDYNASLVNIANSYRVNNLNKEAIELFDKAIENSNDHIKASVYNNRSLSKTAIGNYSDAISDLIKALDIITDEIKIATTYTNIASNYLSLKDLDSCNYYLNMAYEIFKDNKNVFHYMGYLVLKARYEKLIDEKSSIQIYDEALSNILMNVGKTTLYKEVLNEAFELYDKYNIEKHIKGIKLSKMYFESVKEDFLKPIPDIIKPQITVGLFGLGSECFYCSDLISEDHDFDPGFIVLVNDTVSKEDFNIIKSSYENLEKRFKRYYVFNLDKKGVHYVSSYLKEFLGVKGSELSVQSKGLITNGELFYYSKISDFYKLRVKIKKETRENYFEDLALKTLEINQYIPYNLNRCLQRNDQITYKLLKNHLIDRLIEYYYIYHLEYIPHDKLSIKKMNKDSIIYKWIIEILNNDVSDSLCQTISATLLKELHRYGIISKINTIYIEDYRYEIIDFIKEYKEKIDIVSEIVSKEWDYFKVLDNIGGKANCQLNKPYFTLMRKSQWLALSKETLESYLNDLNLGLEYNYNILSFKYGYMMESYDLLNYNKIKDSLPVLSDKRIKLQEEVIKLQLEEKEKLDKEANTNNMRINYSGFDSINNVSYETYLRGELSSYSEKTVYLYAKDLVKAINDNRNLVKQIYDYTYLFYLDEKY